MTLPITFRPHADPGPIKPHELVEARRLLRHHKSLAEVAAIVATRPDLRRRDVDNLIKPISDALKKGGVIEDDSLAHSVTACWSRRAPDKAYGVMVHVEADNEDGV